MRRIDSVVPLLDIGHPDVTCPAHCDNPLWCVWEQQGFFSSEEQTFRPIHLDHHVFLTEIKTDLRWKDECCERFLLTSTRLDNDMSIEEKLKTKKPERWGLDVITFPYYYDDTVRELIRVRLCKGHPIQGDTTKDTSHQKYYFIFVFHFFLPLLSFLPHIFFFIQYSLITLDNILSTIHWSSETGSAHHR